MKKLKVKCKKFIYFSLLLCGILYIVSLTQLIPVKGAETDLGINEGDRYKYTTKIVNKTYSTIYEVGDINIFIIDGIHYDESGKYWIVPVIGYNPYENEVDDLPSLLASFEIPEDGKSANPSGMFIIPKINITGYLSDLASTSSSYHSNQKTITWESGPRNYTSEFNDNGVLIKQTVIDAYSTLYMFELSSNGGNISFGFQFLLFIQIGIISCVLIYYKKTKEGKFDGE